MAQGRQAKILTPRQETAILRYLDTTRYPERDRTIFLLSVKAGMRAKEIAALTWAMVTDGQGRVGDIIALDNRASKGRSGRAIPIHPLLQEALAVAACKQFDAGLQTEAFSDPRSLRIRGRSGPQSLRTGSQSWQRACKQRLGPRFIANGSRD